MSDFDLDSYLFGGNESSQKPKEDKPTETTQEYKPKAQEEDKKQEVQELKTNGFQDLNLGEDSTSSQINKPVAKQSKPNLLEKKPEFPEWTSINKNYASREDIIKSIDIFPKEKKEEVNPTVFTKTKEQEEIEIEPQYQEQPEEFTPEPSLQEPQRPPMPEPNLQETQRPPVPEPNLQETQRPPIPEPSLQETQKPPMPEPNLQETQRPPIPEPSLQETQKPPIPEPNLQETRPPLPIINENLQNQSTAINSEDQFINNQSFTPNTTLPPELPPEPEIVDEKPLHKKKKKKFKIFLYILLILIISASAIFFFLNEDHILIFQEDSAVNRNGRTTSSLTDYDEVEKKNTADTTADTDSTENSFENCMEKILTGDYRIKDSGGFALIYTESVDGQEIQNETEMILGNSNDYTYLHEGKIMYFNAGNGLHVSWDRNNIKYIISNEKEEYTEVHSYSSMYYRNFLGQHILQDLINDYSRNKNRITKNEDNTWAWDWEFYTPINNYQTKNILATQIIIDKNNNYIEEIKLIDSGREIGAYKFEFEESNPMTIENPYTPLEYTLVDKITIT